MERSPRRAALVVDDDPAVVRHIARALDGLGFDAFCAYDAHDALDFLSSRLQRGLRLDLHLLVTDVWMPGILGPSLVARVREDWPGIKVLYVSGGSPGRTFEVGEDELLAKPFDFAALAVAVERAMARTTPDPAADRVVAPKS